jgi:hypothetical protein
MWNYYKTVVINSADAEDGNKMFSATTVFNPETGKLDAPAVNVWRNGQYDLAKVGKITKTEGHKGEKAQMVLDCTSLIPFEEVDGEKVYDLGLYQLTFKVEMDGKFLGDWASPEYNGFYKPFVIGLEFTDVNAEKGANVAKYIAEQINLALAENNKFIKVEAKGDNVVIDATDEYMILKPENVKFEKYEVVGCDTCLGEYIPKKINVKYAKNEKGEEMKGKQPFATGTWLLENQRLPNSNNFRYFGFNDEMPIAGAIYVQYSFDYVSDRPGLGGHSGVGQGITAITNHTFFVEQNAAPKFEEVFGYKAE